MKVRIKVFSVLILLVLLVFFGLLVAFYNPQKPVKVRAGHFITSVTKTDTLKLFAKELSSKNNHFVLGQAAPIEVKKIGQVKTSPFSFNALSSSWEVALPKGAEIHIQVRTSKDGKIWTEWKEIEVDDDGSDYELSNKKYGRLITLEGKFFQEQVVLKTTDINKIPEVKKLNLTYIDSKEKISLLEKILKKLKISLEKVFAAYDAPKRPTDAPAICSRTCWGADESIYVPGEDYAPIKKIIIHHTVTSNNDPDPVSTVRAIYYYHNVVRGWGDIGYNFVIDQNNGTIYEGRRGGDGVIGAHTSGYNSGSVGVAVLGDFRYVGPNKRVQNALHKIVVWKLYSHNIDPDEISVFGRDGFALPAVFVHGRVANTACAGTYLNKFTPSLISLAHFLPQQIVFRNASGLQRIDIGNDTTVEDLLRRYGHYGTVAPNYIRKIATFPSDGSTLPNDPNYLSQWDLVKLDALNVWKDTSGGNPSVKVAVLDSGVAYENYDPAGSENYAKGPDFVHTNFVLGYDFVNHDSHPNDDNGHGTIVASVIAESTNNALGSASLAYNISIMPVKVCDSSGWCIDSDVASGIDFAKANGSKVINLSIVGDDYSEVIQAVINSAWLSGNFISAAAGNGASSNLSYPARGNLVTAVGALTKTSTRAYYSSYGKDLDLMAPGGTGYGGTQDLIYQKLTCTSGRVCTNFSYGTVAGTSIASAVVAATASLMTERFGDATPGNIEAIMRSTATDLGSSGFDANFGYGRINPLSAINYLYIGGYILDGRGGVHEFGTASKADNGNRWPWDIARSIALLPDHSGGYVLDGWGGLHAFGSATPIAHNTHAYWPKWDIARDVILLSSSTPSSPKGYILDGWGGLHAFGGAPTIPNSSHAYWPKWDIVNAVVLNTNDTGGYILDGWGGLHAFGSATPIAHNTHAYWPLWDIARDVVLVPGGGGYILDGYGGVHNFGAAPSISIHSYWPGRDIARSISLNTDGTGGYVLDGLGGIHPLGSSLPFYKSNYAYWIGWDIAKALVLK
ncbi:MAG: hypothetical protein A2172_02945 [Candidatus Woykebacteria bacterium RBG_13_40_15]|uniref:Peptidoglycan recognition protein family domain-containing protein n=1 Tax=Candidatus Woykebacteria bacterium RBG_13_40_15 TaxID=1802593 RepID=A0A1G1W5H0_9BACT|nr:MAG: hypothetical protein A2172_02945 [Candidatus Woykebacteria bacterium RBG_13_40_15]